MCIRGNKYMNVFKINSPVLFIAGCRLKPGESKLSTKKNGVKLILSAVIYIVMFNHVYS